MSELFELQDEMVKLLKELEVHRFRAEIKKLRNELNGYLRVDDHYMKGSDKFKDDLERMRLWIAANPGRCFLLKEVVMELKLMSGHYAKTLLHSHNIIKQPKNKRFYDKDGKMGNGVYYTCT